MPRPRPLAAKIVQEYAGQDITRFFSRDTADDDSDVLHLHSRQASALVVKMRVAVLAQPKTGLSDAEEGAVSLATAEETEATPVSAIAIVQPDAVGGSSVYGVSRAAKLPPVVKPPHKASTNRKVLRCVDVVTEDSAGTVKTCACLAWGPGRSVPSPPPVSFAVIFEGPPGFEYEPGQHGMFLLPGGDDEDVDAPGSIVFSASPRGLKRSWTLSVHPSVARGRVVISVKRGSNASRRLHDNMAAPQGEIHLLGVAGMFTPSLAQPESRPVLLIAGGIGVTPMRAMIPAFVAAKRPVALVYSVRTIAEAPFLAEFTARAGCSVTVTATGEADGSTWTGRRGRVDAALLDACAPGRGGARVCVAFICGPRPFEDACRAALASLGLSSEHIFSESFESTP